jgi:hypothetical protein
MYEPAYSMSNLSTTAPPIIANRPLLPPLAAVRRAHSYQLMMAGIATWVLSYYLVPYTALARTSPGQLLLDFSIQRPRSIGSIGIAAFAAVTVATMAKTSSRQAPSRHFIPFWILAAVLFIPFILTLFSGVSTLLYENVAAIIAAVVTGIFVTQIAGAEITTLAVACLGLLQSAFTIYYARNGINEIQSGDVMRAGGTLNQPDQLYTFMIVAFPLTLMAARRTNNTLLRFFLVLAAAGQFACCMLTWFRGGILGLAASLLFLIWHQTRSRKMLAIATVLAAGLCILVSHHRSSGDTNVASVTRSDAGHMLLWKKGVELVESAPLTGSGVGGVEITTTTPTRDPSNPLTQINSEPKNLFLFYLCEMGIGGGILFIAFSKTTYEILDAALRRIGENGLAVGVGASWIGLLVAGVVDTPFGPPERYAGNCLFGLLIGMTATLVMGASRGAKEGVQ